jgi:hypothetical protein
LHSIHPYSRFELRMIKWIGTRGTILLYFGFMWATLGVSFLLNPTERFSRPGPGGALDFVDKGPGVYILSSMWLVGGLVAVGCAIRRPYTCEDGVGFNGLALPPFFWAASYWWSFAIHIISGGEFGRERTYIGGLLYTAITLSMIFLSRHLQDHPEGPCMRRHSVAPQ